LEFPGTALKGGVPHRPFYHLPSKTPSCLLLSASKAQNSQTRPGLRIHCQQADLEEEVAEAEAEVAEAEVAEAKAAEAEEVIRVLLELLDEAEV